MALRNEGAEAALAYINRAIATQRLLCDYVDTRAVIYMALGEPEKAIIDLEKVTKSDPKPAELFHLAQAHHQSKNQGTAKQDLLKAKSKGLSEEKLHKLEIPAYRKLLEELGPL